LDGRELFRIASPAVLNRSEPGTQIPVEVRATQVESNLEQLVTVGSVNGVPLDPETLEVVVETINGQPVLLAKDREQVEARVLLTVTDTDAQYHSTSQQNLATIWQRILEQELRQAIELRRPEAFRQQVILVTKVLSATVLLTVLLGAAWVALGRRRSRLKQQQVVVFFSKG
jgi:small conductance mechanosensitive channel